jgi:hypothetical protein
VINIEGKFAEFLLCNDKDRYWGRLLLHVSMLPSAFESILCIVVRNSDHGSSSETAVHEGGTFEAKIEGRHVLDQANWIPVLAY